MLYCSTREWRIRGFKLWIKIFQTSFTNWSLIVSETLSSLLNVGINHHQRILHFHFIYLNRYSHIYRRQLINCSISILSWSIKALSCYQNNIGYCHKQNWLGKNKLQIKRDHIKNTESVKTQHKVKAPKVNFVVVFFYLLLVQMTKVV